MRVPRVLILLLSSVLTVALVAAAAPVRLPAPARARAGRRATAAAMALPDTISFNEHIRPIFVNNCFRCHGSDPGSRKAELRLDRPEFAFAPRANGQPVIVKGDPGAQRPRAADHLHRSRQGHAPARDAQDPGAPRESTSRALDQGRCPVPAALGAHQARAQGAARGAPGGPRPQPHRPLRPGPPGRRGADAQSGGRSSHPRPPRHPRPDRPAAHPGRGGGLRPRRIPEGLRSAGRPAARPSELRRAPGALLARLRALRRHPRLSLRQLPQHLALPRLGDPRLQRQPALRPVHAGADRRGHAPEADARPADRHGLHPRRDEHQRGRHHRRGEPGHLRDGPRRDDFAGLAGADRGLRACHDHKFDPISTKDFYSMAAFFRNTTQPAMDKNVMDSPPILRMPRAEDAKRYAALPGEIDAAKKAYDSHVKAAEPAFVAWQQTQGPADLPTIGDERLDFRLLSDPAEPTTLRNVVSPDRTFTFTGGKPLAVTSPLGPARPPSQGRHRRSRRSGRRRVRRALLVRRLGPGHRHRRRRAPGPHGHRERLPRLGPLHEGQPRRGPDHQLLEPGRPSRGGGARREVGRVASRLRDLRRLTEGQRRQDLLRRRDPGRL